jgi:outer membrane immunogenic protein
MKTLVSLGLLLSVLPALALAEDRASSAATQSTEVALGYTYIRANAPPDQCDCFSMNGGSVSIAQPFNVGSLQSGSVAIVFDATLAHASGISSGDYGLTLSTYTWGLRYRPLPQSAWSPFAQVLLGASHASGTLVKGDTPAAKDATFEFASVLGGGIDRWIGDHWSLRVLEVDYLLTTYSNRTDDRQNNLRVSIGAAYHF